MKPYIIQSILLLVAGVLYLFSAPQYAKATSTCSGSALEFAFGFPAGVFTVAGTVMVVAGILVMIINIGNQNRR